jgi:hypothetical protein
MEKENSTYSKGKKYEDFIEEVYNILNKDICKNPSIFKNYNLERNKKIKSHYNDKVEHEIDIYWEYELNNGITNKVAIECKDYKSNVSKSRITDFNQKLKDITNISGIFVSRNDFQSGAIEFAKQENIELIKIREPNDDDWKQLIKIIEFNLIAIIPPKFIKFTKVVCDKDYYLNSDIENGDKLEFIGTQDKIILEDKTCNWKYSIFDLENNGILNSNILGINIFKKEFSDGYLYLGNKTYKIKYLEFEYNVSSPIKNNIKIDFSINAFAFMKYINKNCDYMLFKDGLKKNWD